jgi:hypothetical protein
LRLSVRWSRLARVKSSEEIRSVIARWTRASAEGDEECLTRLSEHEGTLIVHRIQRPRRVTFPHAGLGERCETRAYPPLAGRRKLPSSSKPKPGL